MMPEQPPDDNCNELYQTILALAEEIMTQIPEADLPKAMRLLTYEVLGHLEPAVEEVPGEPQPLPF